MKQQLTSEQRRPRAGRWFARALFVVGGALAGTAAAWAISSGTASADTALPQEPSPVVAVQQDAGGQQDTAQQETDLLPDQSVTPTTDAVLGAAADGFDATTEFAGRAAGTAVQYGTASAPWAADAADRGQQAAGEVKDAVHQFAADAVISPAHRVLGTAEQVARRPQDAPKVIQQAITPPASFLDFLHPGAIGAIALPHLPGSADPSHHIGTPVAMAPAPAAPAAAQVAPAGPMGPVLAGPVAQHHLTKLGLDASAESRSHGHHKTVKLPQDPAQGPMAPSGVPSAPGGASTGGHLDGPLLGFAAAAPTVVGAHSLRALRTGIRHTPAEPGEQPGVTPD